LLPKQGVVGPNPITRSITNKGGACLKKLSIGILLNRYTIAARAEGLSQETTKIVAFSVNSFASFLGGCDDVTKVTADDLCAFIVILQQKERWSDHPKIHTRGKLSATSINTYVRSIKAFWSWLEKEKIIKANPLASVPAPKLPKKLPKTLTEDQLRVVFKVANPRERLILEIFMDTGMRLGEFSGLMVDDVDTRGGIVKVFGKGGKERNVFISDETALSVETYRVFDRPDEPARKELLLTCDGYPLTAGRVEKILQRLGEKAGITTRLSAHKLRHTFATLTLKYGGNLEYVRRILGHTDIKTTEIYLDVADKDIAEAHKQFSPVVNLGLRNKIK
jgi:site-specific recombinase XerD